MFFLFLYVVLPVFFIILFKKKVKYHHVPFVFFLILSLIRYDTVSDYFNYVVKFWDIRKGITNYVTFEIGYLSLNKLFSFSKWGFIPLLGICIYLPFIGVKKLLKEYDVFFIGFFVFIAFGMITRLENIVRQGFAMGVFFLSIDLIKKGKLFKYTLRVVFASLFHTSAVALIPFYFLIKKCRTINVRPAISLTLLSIVFVLYATGLFFELVKPVFGMYEKYVNYFTLRSSNSVSSYFIVAFKVILSWYPSLFFYGKNKSEDVNMVINISWISMLGYMIFHDFLVLDRVFEYLYIFQIIAIALTVKTLLFKKRLVPVLFIISPLFIYHSYFVYRYYGTNKYQTVFSEDCMEHRLYMRSFDFTDAKEFQNRDKKVKFFP